MTKWFAFASVALVCGLVSEARAQAPCESLAALSLAGTTVTSVGNVASGGFTPPANVSPYSVGDPSAYKALPAFCRVQLQARPSADSDIKIEVWLPVAGWNGRFRADGKRRLRGGDRLPRAGDSARAGLRHGRHRHRPFRVVHRRPLGARPSGEGSRLRLPRHPRDDTDSEGRDPDVLRQGTARLVLCELLERGPPGADGGAAIPGRLRRAPRRRAGERLDASAHERRLRRAGHHQRRRQLHSTEQAADYRARGRGRLRRAGRRA